MLAVLVDGPFHEISPDASSGFTPDITCIYTALQWRWLKKKSTSPSRCRPLLLRSSSLYLLYYMIRDDYNAANQQTCWLYSTFYTMRWSFFISSYLIFPPPFDPDSRSSSFTMISCQGRPGPVLFTFNKSRRVWQLLLTNNLGRQANNWLCGFMVDVVVTFELVEAYCFLVCVYL